jgi:hypothetical protein
MESNEIIAAAQNGMAQLTTLLFALGDLLLLARKTEFPKANGPRNTQYAALFRRLRGIVPNVKLLRAVAADFPASTRREGLLFGHYVALYKKDAKFKRRIISEVLSRGLTVAETRALIRTREKKVKTITEELTLEINPDAKPPKLNV